MSEINKGNINSIKKVIAVGSGKGGVGKSLISSLIAIKLKKEGFKVGILDADITGPSIQKMFGLNNQNVYDEMGIFPLKSKTGILISSISMMLESTDTPTIWRGPMLSNVLLQLWNETIWEELDYLIIDMPPGTSDIAITAYQSIPIDGIVIVTAPQELVNSIVKKFYNMSKKMNIKVIGLVENMSYFKCEKCNSTYNIFGESKVENLAKELETIVIDKIPIDIKLSEFVDQGNIEEYELDKILNNIKEDLK